MRARTAAPLLISLLAGCSFIPNYHRPALPVATEWPIPAPLTHGPLASDIGWRNFFADPALQGLIAFSLVHNSNLRVAVLNVSQAQAQYTLDRSALFPAVQGEGILYNTHTPAGATGGLSLSYREYSLVGAVSWELDLFGKIRSQAQAAREQYLSNTDTVLSERTSLVSQVAAEYYTWLADRDSLRIAQETASAQQQSLRLTQLAADQGIDTAMDVAQAQTTVDTALANVAQYTRQVAQDMDEVVLLAGAPLPPELLQQMQAVSGLDASPALPDVPAGLPSDLLERRPDIRAAEHTLLAANANIGAARAAFFPSVSLTGDGGAASSKLNHLFAPGNHVWTFEPTVTLPIFIGGQNIANLDIAKLQKRIEIANYENAIQSAFHDVSDALNARGTYVMQLQAEQNLVAADMQYYNLANMQLTAGTNTYLNVLIAENSLLTARLDLVSLKLAALQNNITLYKALGGGWQEYTAAAPTLP